METYHLQLRLIFHEKEKREDFEWMDALESTYWVHKSFICILVNINIFYICNKIFNIDYKELPERAKDFCKSEKVEYYIEFGYKEIYYTEFGYKARLCKVQLFKFRRFYQIIF